VAGAGLFKLRSVRLTSACSSRSHLGLTRIPVGFLRIVTGAAAEFASGSRFVWPLLLDSDFFVLRPATAITCAKGLGFFFWGGLLPTFMNLLILNFGSNK
jgi:hypothetical protein